MVRRVFTARDDDGRSYIAEDGEASAVFDLPGGLQFHELWRTAGPTASNIGTEDPIGPTLEVMPDRGGTALRVVEVAPAQPGAAVELHESPTTDYNIVIRGEIWAVSDTGEVLLRPGDVIVQRGGRHGWRNPGPDSCVFASVMVNDR